MEQTKKYALIIEQELLRGMMGGRDSCANCLAMFRVHGEIDLKRLETAIQKVIDDNPALRLVFKAAQDGVIYQQLGGEYWYTLDFRDISGTEDPEAELRHQMFNMIDEHTHFDGEFMFNFTLFRMAPGEYHFVSCVNHIISDGISNRFIVGKIISSYNGDADQDKQSQQTYLDYLEESEELLRSGALELHRKYWEKEVDGYQDAVTFPQGERRKYPAKILQTVSTEEISRIAKRFSVSSAGVNLFLCHLAYSVSLDCTDLAINVAEQNRSRKYRQTIGTFATTLFHRVRFAEGTSLHEALTDSFQKLNENYEHSRCIAPKKTPFIFSYENFLGKEQTEMKLGDAVVESYMGTLEAKVWNIFSMLIFENAEQIIYKVGYDEEVFSEDMIRRFLSAFALGTKVLLGEDMTYAKFAEMIK